MSRVCLIIVNYNGAAYIQDCLDAVQAQQRAPERVILIDNASTDDSIELIEQHPLPLELIRNKDNLGFATANNQAARLAEDCDWLALLNPDTQADPGWLASLLHSSQTNPDDKSFASLQIAADDSTLCDGAGDVYHAIGYAWRRAHNSRDIASLADEEPVFSACAAAWLIDRALFLQLGGFDEDYFCYGEDVDLGFRLNLAGHRTLFVKAAVVGHRQSASTGLDSEFSIYHGQRNLVWTYLKNMPLGLLLLSFIPHLLFNLLGLLRFFALGRGREAWCAKLDALRALPDIRRKRRRVQCTIKQCSTMALARQMEWSPGRLGSRLRGARRTA